MMDSCQLLQFVDAWLCQELSAIMTKMEWSKGLKFVLRKDAPGGLRRSASCQISVFEFRNCSGGARIWECARWLAGRQVGAKKPKKRLESRFWIYRVGQTSAYPQIDPWIMGTKQPYTWARHPLRGKSRLCSRMGPLCRKFCNEDNLKG